MAYFASTIPSTELLSRPFLTEPGKKRDIIEGLTMRHFQATGQPSESSPPVSFVKAAGL